MYHCLRFSFLLITYEIAEKVVKFLQKTYDDAMAQPLQEETFKKTKNLRMLLGYWKNIKRQIKPEENSLKLHLINGKGN